MQKPMIGLVAALLLASPALAQTTPDRQPDTKQDQTSTIPSQKPKDAVEPPTSPSGSRAGANSADEMNQDLHGVLPAPETK